ncbi:protein of unknown function [Clostridium beijerinckii]|nr:protein of unknown function [Clostridium beijerinckii]
MNWISVLDICNEITIIEVYENNYLEIELKKYIEFKEAFLWHFKKKVLNHLIKGTWYKLGFTLLFVNQGELSSLCMVIMNIHVDICT